MSARDVEVIGREARRDGRGDEVRLDLRVPEDLAYFEGHFEADPVLPAAAVLDAVVLPAVEASFPGLGGARALQGLRFSAPVRPGQRLTLALRLGSAGVRFTLAGEAGGLAEGTIALGAPATRADGAGP